MEQIFLDYEDNKNAIKELLNDKDFLVDRHKISAFFIGAILNNNPIKVKNNILETSNEQEELVLNTNLALSFANEIIKRFRKKENKNEKFKIIIPKSSSTKAYEDQLATLIKELNDSFKNENKKILLLAISHILFLLEKYSEIIINENNI